MYGGKKTYKNKGFKSSYGYNHQKPKQDLYIKKIETVEKSEEEGFTGTPDKWFSDEEFYKKLITKNDGKDKDYYFNSYSSFYIHEEMIKDKIRTETYKRAIEKNADTFKDKVTLSIIT